MRKSNFTSTTIKPKTDGPMYQGVKGRTLIDHRSRIKLDLNYEAYCIMDYLDALSDKNDVANIDSKKADFYEYMGLEIEEVMDLVSHLEEKGFLLCDAAKDKVTITKKWRDVFPKATDSFEDLWKVFAKGSKAKALSRYKEVIKTTDHALLMKRRQAYVDYKKSTKSAFQYYMGLDVWLNPTDRHWEDPLPTDVMPAASAEYQYKPAQ